MAVAGDTIVVGAAGEGSNTTGVNGNQTNNSAYASGATYVFIRNGTSWSHQAYLKASNTGGPTSPEVEGDRFGYSVAVSADTVVIGAFAEDSNATGVNGNQDNNSARTSGAAYVFVRGGTNWSQRAYLKASDTLASNQFGDWFGNAVTVSGDTVVVGSPFEDSNAAGVNGNSSDNSAPDSGAAYVFTFSTHINILPDDSGGYFVRFDGIPGRTYRLQRAPNVTGPWDTIATNTAPASGLIEIHDTPPPPGQAFYRTVQP